MYYLRHELGHEFRKRVNGLSQLARRAFTLIELLVVIAIIALLLAILGPSLGRAKDQVEETVCRSSLKQWGLVFALYANDNEDRFPPNIPAYGLNDEDAWVLGAMTPYYEDLDLRDCPSTKSLNRPPDVENMGGTFHQWGPMPYSNGTFWWDSYAEGSFGFNNWVADPPPEMETFWGLPTVNTVRTIYEKGANMIPVVCDSVWFDITPWEKDLAPSNNEHEMDDYDAAWSTNSMKYTCIDRHNGGINAVFLDMDVRHVGIKQLWLLKWHMNWVKRSPLNAWPTWTDKYKDY